MNKFLKKAMISLASMTITITAFSSVFAMPTLLDQDKTTKHLSSGVVHENIKQFHSSGWWNINVLRVDLGDEYTKINTIFSDKGISETDTVTNMMESSNAIGAINGDFFSMASPKFPLGPTISNGEMISSPIFNEGKNAPVFSIDKNNNPFMSYWNWQINLIAPNGNTLPVITVNKDSGSYDRAIVFTDKWGGTSHKGQTNDVVDMVVVNNIVTEIRVGQSPIYVPQGATVVSAKGSAKNFILNNFSVASKVDFNSAGNVDFNNISTAVGGGSWLLKDGVKTAFDKNIKGNHPRTAVGISQDKKQVIMVTVDGRNDVFTGVSQEVLASIMKNLGASDALNMDGGGSTTMATKGREDAHAQVTNILSGGAQRRVSNSIAVFDSAPIGPLYRLELVSEDKNIFNNTSRAIDIVGYDKYQHKLPVNLKDVKFTVEEANGSFIGNVFKPTSAGKTKVKANINGVVGEMTFNVLDNLKEIQFINNKIGLAPSASHNIGDATATDRRGVKTKIHPNDFTWETIGDIGKVENGIFYASDLPSSGALVARLNGAVRTIPVSIGLKDKPISNLDSLNGISTSSYPPNLVGGSISLDSDKKVGNSSIKIDYDFTKTDKTRAFYTIFGSGMKLNGNPSRIGLWINGNDDKTWVRGDMLDANGKSFKLDFAKTVDWTGWKNVSAEIPTDAKYPVTLQKIYVAQIDPNNRTVSSMKINGITGLYTNDVILDPSLVPDSSVFKDDTNILSPVLDGGYKFLIASSANTQGFRNLLSTNKYSFVFGNLNPNMSAGLNDVTIRPLDNGFRSEAFGSTRFIKVNNTPNSIRVSHPEQWLWMKGAIKNAKEKNIIIMLPKSIYAFTDKMEQDLFHKMIAESNESDKNISVVYASDKTDITFKDGVKYFEVNKFKAGHRFEFVVNGDNVTYQMFR